MHPDLKWLTARPIAHRGLHNADAKIYENTLSACRAAMDNGHNIEVDLHPARDGTPVVFHDLTLERMSGDTRSVRDMDFQQLRSVKIRDSRDHISSLDELLRQTDGKTGLVLEMKGVVGEDAGFVEAIAASLKDYDGPVALMSFFHWLIADARKFAPLVPLGLVAKGDASTYASHMSAVDKFDVDFASYNIGGLPCRFTREFRKSGKPLTCWTVRTREQQIEALRHSDQITFEGFTP